MLSDVAKGQMDIREGCFDLLVAAPPNNAHVRSIPKPVALSLDALFLMGTMDEIMTGLTKRDEIIWAIPTCLA